MKILSYNEMEKQSLFFRTLESSGVADTVREIIETVSQEGDRALVDYARRFDRAELTALEVTPAELDAALASIPADLLLAMQTAAENIRAFHSMQLREGFRLERPNGVYLGQKVTPIEKVGLYIPGGTASYPSTVFMNAIPAKLAGCPLIVMVSPPNANGAIAAPIPRVPPVTSAIPVMILRLHFSGHAARFPPSRLSGLLVSILMSVVIAAFPPRIKCGLWPA